MEQIALFAMQFGAKFVLNPEFVVKTNQRYYLINPRIKKLMCKDFFYSGLYLGQFKNDVFFPSFNLLNMIAKVATNKVFLDKKTAWLFICGRDIFRKGITTVLGIQENGSFTLIINEFGECLGFGQIIEKMDSSGDRIVIRNILDVGDFLRREN